VRRSGRSCEPRRLASSRLRPSSRFRIMKIITGGVALALIGAMSAIGASQTLTLPRKFAASPTSAPTGTMAQIMRGIYFPSSNLIFDVQQRDPGVPVKKNGAGGSATAMYAGTYSGWEVVENAAIALTDGVDLMLTPGRMCQNGRPAPVRDPAFQKFAQEMRAAGLTVLQAARTKSQEKVSDATNDLADACSGCHQAYRRGPAGSRSRCTLAPMK
jgi:hypothetical protein